MLSHFSDDDAAEPLQTRLALKNLLPQSPVKLSYYLLDETHDGSLVREEIVTGVSAASYLTLPVFTTYLVTIEPAELDG